MLLLLLQVLLVAADGGEALAKEGRVGQGDVGKVEVVAAAHRATTATSRQASDMRLKGRAFVVATGLLSGVEAMVRVSRARVHAHVMQIRPKHMWRKGSVKRAQI